MKTISPLPTRFAVLAHPSIPRTTPEANRVQQYLEQKGAKAICGHLDEPEICQQIASGEVDIVIVLGGDGAMLHAGHACSAASIPLLGINFGRFGFLMEVQNNAWKRYLTRLLKGDYRIEERMMLSAEHWRAKTKLAEWEVLNEVVVCRGQLVKPLHLIASIDGHRLTTYVADGLIAATPTGSTAYALAAGGPIMPPELRNILLVPVAPHLTVDQAVILSEGARVSITVASTHPAVLSVDGQDPITIQKGDRVDVFASGHSIRFVRFQNAGYFYRNLMSHMENNPATRKRR
jgi:NAD+ kinase